MTPDHPKEGRRTGWKEERDEEKEGRKERKVTKLKRKMSSGKKQNRLFKESGTAPKGITYA